MTAGREVEPDFETLRKRRYPSLRCSARTTWGSSASTTTRAASSGRCACEAHVERRGLFPEAAFQHGLVDTAVTVSMAVFRGNLRLMALLVASAYEAAAT